MLQEQVHKENRLRRLRERVTEAEQEGKYQEAKERLSKEEARAREVRDRVGMQAQEIKKRLMNFR